MGAAHRLVHNGVGTIIPGLRTTAIADKGRNFYAAGYNAEVGVLKE
jgi:hypothetical protein